MCGWGPVAGEEGAQVAFQRFCIFEVRTDVRVEVRAGRGVALVIRPSKH